MRKFKKNVCILTAAVMMMASLAGCSKSTATDNKDSVTETPAATKEPAASDDTASSTGVVDGTYSSTQTGFGGDVTVTVTIADGKITDVAIDGAGETATVGQAAIPDLQKEILEAQSPEIDTVTGATVTSKAVIAGVTDALTAAGMVFSTEKAEGVDEEVTTDVLVIGMGASGVMAALNASESGVSVLGIEASGVLGGCGNAAQGMFAIGTSLQEERYGKDMSSEEEKWFNNYMEQSNYLANAQLVRTFVGEAKNTVEYLLDHDVNVYLADTAQQIAHFDETIVYHRWNNTDPFTHLGEYLDKNNVDIRYNTVAYELLTDESGAVVGALATKEDGGKLTIHANAVIVSTGSFAGNEEMMSETLGDDIYDTVFVIGGNDGSGVNMMYNVGASKGEYLSMNHGVGPKANGLAIADQLTMNTPILWVNSNGQRFMNEDLLKDTVEFSSAVLAQGGYAYTIIDQATLDRWCDSSYENTGSWIHYWDRNGMLDANGERTIYHEIIDKDAFLSDFDILTQAGDGIVANSLEEVANYIGCDVSTLTNTVTNYNSYVENGYDEEFFKSKESLLWGVNEGPYYVTKGYNAVLGALGGVNVTNDLEVVDDNNKAIPGLYATGNNASGISIAAYVNIEGTGLGFALTSGRLAGLSAAEYARVK